MNSFVHEAKNQANRTTTENGALAYKSTNSALIDLFGVIGSLRDADENRIIRLFRNAFAENKLYALKTLFYARYIRGGLGERRTFKIILNDLAKNYPSIVEKNLGNIPFFGRWDDLYALVGTPVEDAMWRMIKDQLVEDLQNYQTDNPISLMAKWLKSVNTSSNESKMLGKMTAKNLNIPERTYRKVLSILRNYIDVTERKMTSNDWDKIDYSAVPSKAMANYHSAFQKHDNERFSRFMTKVNNGEEKINSATLYPYEIFEKMKLGHVWDSYGEEKFYLNEDPVLEAQWKALPNYVEDGANFLVMADTSGSMYGRPIATSLSLATYFAEHNTGPFANCFMTFSSEPNFVFLRKNDSLKDKIKDIPAIVSNTNLEAAFDLVLTTAIKSNCSPEEMPKAIIVISDGEIDRLTGHSEFYKSYCRNHENDSFDFIPYMREKFTRAGYEMPNIVLWNVASRHDCYLATTEFSGVQFASGQSPSVFKSLIANVGKSAYEVMMNTLNDPVYDRVVL